MKLNTHKQILIISSHHGCKMQHDEEFDAKTTIKAVEAIEK